MPPSRNPQRRSERSAEAVTTAAMQLCAEVGYSKLSIEGIAARAGVGKQTIYRWWPSKGAVLLDAFLDAMNLQAQFPDTGDLIADLRTQMTRGIGALIGPNAALGPYYQALIGEAQHDPALGQALHSRLIEPLTEAAVNRIRTAQEHGQVRKDVDPYLVVELLYGATYHQWLLQQKAPTEERITAALQTLFRGIAEPHP